MVEAYRWRGGDGVSVMAAGSANEAKIAVMQDERHTRVRWLIGRTFRRDPQTIKVEAPLTSLLLLLFLVLLKQLARPGARCRGASRRVGCELGEDPRQLLDLDRSIVQWLGRFGWCLK